jgi:hypothetical protein
MNIVYLFVYVLFNEIASSSDIIILNARWENIELERMWKETVITYFDILSWRLPAGAVENHRPSVRIVNVPATIQTGHPPTDVHIRSIKHMSQLSWWC